MKSYSWNSRIPGRDLKPKPTEYEAQHILFRISSLIFVFVYMLTIFSDESCEVHNKDIFTDIFMILYRDGGTC
jgi:hypothetical protein